MNELNIELKKKLAYTVFPRHQEISEEERPNYDPEKYERVEHWHGGAPVLLPYTVEMADRLNEKKVWAFNSKEAAQKAMGTRAKWVDFQGTLIDIKHHCNVYVLEAALIIKGRSNEYPLLRVVVRHDFVTRAKRMNQFMEGKLKDLEVYENHDS